MKEKKTLLCLSVVIVLVMGVIGIAYAQSQYLTALSAACPGTSCTSCHPSGGPPPFTAYGTSFSNISSHSSNPSGAIATLGCPGGTPPTTCTSFTYNAWGACQSNNTRTRTVATSSPSGCTGGSPVTTQACTYTPPACTSYTYTWGACQPNGTQTATSTTGVPAGCSGGVTPVTTRSCTYTATTCTSYTYTLGACQSNNTAPVTSYVGIPAGCSGGLSPATTQPCTYSPPQNPGMLMSPATSGLYWDDVNKRMGVGTATPMAHLQIGATTPPNIATPWDFYSYNASYGRVGIDSGVNNAGLEFLESTVRKWFIGSYSGTFGVYNIPAAAFELTITPSGNVGIGTTTPKQALEVNGGVRLNTATTQPVCDANARGTFWIDQYPTGDFVEVCILSGGSYVWRTIVQ